MNLGIVGSRDLYVTSAELDDILALRKLQPDTIVSGGARGVDRCAEVYAALKGIQFNIFCPDYARYGKRAPLERNKQIVASADAVLAIWDGKSRGTKFTLDYAEKQGVPTFIHLVSYGRTV